MSTVAAALRALAESLIPTTNSAWRSLLDDLADPKSTQGSCDSRTRSSLEAAWMLVQEAERLRPHSDAKAGVVYTPQRLARALAALLPPHAPAILDPCCGKGALLLAVFEQVRQRAPQVPAHHHLDGLWGWDVDPLSVATTRVVLAAAAGLPTLSEPDADRVAERLRRQLYVADALFDGLSDAHPVGGFPAIIANPPYQRASRRGREELSRRYSTAVGAFDLFVPFIERALELLSDGGRAVLITSNKFLSADYGRAVRALLAQRRLEMVFDLTEDHTFDALIDAAITVVTKAPPSSTVFARAKAPLPELTEVLVETRALCAGSVRDDTWVLAENLPCAPWGPKGAWNLSVLGPTRQTIERMRSFGLTLGDLFPLRTGVMGFDYHAVVDEIVDGPLGAGERAVATNSVLQPCESLWGKTTVKLAKRPLTRPKLTCKPAALSDAAWDWSGQPKLVIPGVKSKLIAVYDAQGVLAPLVAVHGAAMEEAAGYSIAALLCSAPVGWLYECEQRGTQIPRGSKRFSVRTLASIPLPCPLGELIEALYELGRSLHESPHDAALWRTLNARVATLFGVSERELV